MMGVITGVEAISVPVRNIQRAIEWYGSALGAKPSEYRLDDLCPLEFDDFKKPEIRLVEVQTPCRLRLIGESGEKWAAFRIACVDATKMYRSLEQAGFYVFDLHIDEDGDGASFLIEDIDGNIFAITDLLVR
jgi:predicted enzyme related to lactoylglutathione lyase